MLASNNTKITKMSSVLTNLGREIGQEEAKESKNTELINGLVMEYTGVKKTIYGLISELLTSSEEFNTSLELMQESAFIGDAATRVVTDNMVKPQDIHNKYKADVETLIAALEREISITREEKVVVRADSRESSRTNSPVPNNKRNHGMFTYMSCSDPSHLDGGISLNEK